MDPIGERTYSVTNYEGRKKAYYAQGRKKAKRNTTKVTKLFKKKVQKVINANMEDKCAYLSVVNINYNSGINSTGDLNNLMPNVSNNVNDNGRIGDQVKMHSLNVRGHILSSLVYTSYSQCRIGVRMMIVSPKHYTAYSAILANSTQWLNTLLKKKGVHKLPLLA